MFSFASKRLLVRAFSTTSTRCATKTVGIRRPVAYVRTFVTQAEATVEEDLDAALDDILGGDSFAAKSTRIKERNGAVEQANGSVEVDGTHIEGSKPIPKTLVEKDDPVDFNDPNFLSTSNPYWIEAGLSQKVIDVLSQKGIVRFTPVQAEAFGPILARRDVIGRSRTGTGKTLAFGLPGLTRISELADKKGLREANGRMRKGRPVSMIVLCPTRELARQVQDELSLVARPLGLFVDVFHGGVSYDGQSRSLRNGVDVVVGTPGRIIDHIQRGNLNLSECEIAILDEADEMLNMGFAEDVEVILENVGSKNEEKTQCLLFSATTPPWVKEIGRQYQQDVLSIDSTANQTGARTATTVRHTAVQIPPGSDAKRAILEDIIAVEISKDADIKAAVTDELLKDNPIAAAAMAEKQKGANAMQQKLFGKTIVFVETKREADELVSGGVFKSLSAQALHGDVGQKQRDSTLNAFRKGAFNVLVATDVAARGIDIKDVDLVIQFQPPRDVDTYVHRSGRTGRAGSTGTSVLLFNQREARDIVKIERGLGHGFKFELVGPPSIEAALNAAAKTSAIACASIPEDTAEHFKEAAATLLENSEDPQEIVAKCLAAISRRASEVQSRSLLTGELGMATVEMSNSKGRPVSPGDVMFTVSKLSRMSRREGDTVFDSDVGKIQSNPETGTAVFDMGVEDAKALVNFSKDIDAGGAGFTILKEMEIERGHNFGKSFERRGGGGGGGGYRGRNGGGDRRGGDGYRGRNNFGGGNSRSSYAGHRSSNSHYSPRSKSNNDGRQGSEGGYRKRYDRNEGGGGGYRAKRHDGGGKPRHDGGGKPRHDGGGAGRRSNNDGW
jgi:ATP-dependent RNA helicase DDX21